MTQIPSRHQLNEDLDSKLWPVFEEIQGDLESIRFNFTVGDQLGYFKGHFPGHAVLPGVVQVHWAAELARRCLKCAGFSALKKVKFKHPIVPGTAATLSLAFRPQTGTLDFRFYDADLTFSSGVMLFEAGE